MPRTKRSGTNAFSENTAFCSSSPSLSSLFHLSLLLFSFASHHLRVCFFFLHLSSAPFPCYDPHELLPLVFPFARLQFIFLRDASLFPSSFFSCIDTDFFLALDEPPFHPTYSFGRRSDRLLRFDPLHPRRRPNEPVFGPTRLV